MQIVDSSANPCDHSGVGLVVYPLRGFPNAVAGLRNDAQSLHRFVVGSNEYSTSNEIVVVDFDEDTRTSSVVAKVESLHPVQHLLDFSYAADRLQFWLAQKDLDSNATYVKVVELDSCNNSKLDTINSVKLPKGTVKSISADPFSVKQVDAKLAVVQPASIGLLKLTDSTIEIANRLDLKPPQSTGSLSNSFDEYRRRFITGKFDPHHRDLFGCTIADRFEIYDWRQTSDHLVAVRNGCFHTGDVLDLDFNPNVPNEVVTVGQDAKNAFWDLRNTVKPLEVLDTGHKNCIQYVKYNCFHDQLILTGGPSSTLLHLREGGNTTNIYNSAASSRDACWSTSDAWHFVALSDNKLVFDTIPASVKYKLLL